MHLGLEDETHGIDQDMALAPLDLLAGIEAEMPACLGAGLDRLAVDDGVGGTFLAALQRAGPAVKGVVDGRPGAVAREALEVVMHRAFGREVLRQKPPLAARLQKIENPIDHGPQVRPAPAAP